MQKLGVSCVQKTYANPAHLVNHCVKWRNGPALLFCPSELQKVHSISMRQMLSKTVSRLHPFQTQNCRSVFSLTGKVLTSINTTR